MTSDSVAETSAPEPALLEFLPVDDRQLYRDEWAAAPGSGGGPAAPMAKYQPVMVRRPAHQR